MTKDRIPWRTRHRARLLQAVVDRFASGAFISFEGQLEKVPLAKFANASLDETAALKRNTLRPKQGFVVLPIESLPASKLMAALGGSIPSAILHIQIETTGRLVFGAYDNFQHLFFGDAISEEFLKQLIADETIEPAT